MGFHIINEDITNLEVDSIVNAANTELKMGGGVCGAIFRAAGPYKLTKACDKLAPIKTSQAVITPGFDLASKYIIHSPGPIYNNENKNESKKLLETSYINSLNLAKDNNIKSIAFPLISAGIYGYPQKQAFDIAKESIESFLEENDMTVYLTIFDEDFYQRLTSN